MFEARSNTRLASISSLRWQFCRFLSASVFASSVSQVGQRPNVVRVSELFEEAYGAAAATEERNFLRHARPRP